MNVGAVERGRVDSVLSVHLVVVRPVEPLPVHIVVDGERVVDPGNRQRRDHIKRSVTQGNASDLLLLGEEQETLVHCDITNK